MSYRLTQGSTQDLPDVAAFVATLNQLATHPMVEVRELFDPTCDFILTRAPGRLDVMGGIADYSGSLVLQMPLRAATIVALQSECSRDQPSPSRHVHIVSLSADMHHRAVAVDLPLAALEEPDGTPLDYEAARQFFARDQQRGWAAYVAGAFLVLMRERGVRFATGARLLISSSVPEGKGVSSSAALEVAAMQAIATAFHIDLRGAELARLAQLVEHRVVGAPCGIMDQMTATCGERDRLLVLRCQPADLKPSLAWPEDLGLWGIDSGERHAVSGADYSSVRVGAFMGYRMVADLAGLPVTKSEAAENGHVFVNDPIWHGYLANVTPDEFERRFAAHLPERMRGADFLARYGGTSDPITTVRPHGDYAVRAPTRHPIEEHARIQLFAELLATQTPTGPDRAQRLRLGDLMYASHQGYVQCGLDSRGTSRLVSLVRNAGASAGLFGARITGGGSGGTVAVLGHRDAAPAVARIAAQYAAESGHPADIITGSSPGAAQFGHLRLKPIVP